MPPERRLECVNLVQRLLDLVLAHVAKAGVQRCLQRIESVGLGHSNKGDRAASLSTAATRGFINPIPNLLNPVWQVEVRHKAATYR